nr:MAG: hypothetical protein DIU55_09450 [Bacillota bacterium]
MNGQEIQADNVIVDDVPYVSLVDMAEHLGLEHEWDARGRIAQVWRKSEARTVTLEEKVDPFKPVIDLTVVGLRGEQVGAVGLQMGSDWVPVPFQVGLNRLTIGEPDGTAPVLALDQRFTLTIYAKNGSAYRIDFATSGLPDLTSTGQRRVVRVPAMPEKGFHWPYFLVLPSDANKKANQGHKRYLVVETNNTGPDDPLPVLLKETRQDLERGFSSAIAEELWSPLLMPAFPRPHVAWHDGTQWRVLYTHALDRDTATLHLAFADPRTARAAESAIRSAGYTPESLTHLDRQLAAMIDHAISYLNQYGHNVEPKVFLVGYSASGTFVDRCANLHPHKVKAVASGATLDDMMLPLASYGGEDLIFPIGTADYQAITGRPFDLNAHNQVPRLIFMGEDDTNNTLPYSDTYSDDERGIIQRLWGEEILPRAKQLIELYGKAGGKGIFILDKGMQHSMSQEMQDYVITFLKANRDGAEPVYPMPGNPAHLQYTLHD